MVERILRVVWRNTRMPVEATEGMNEVVVVSTCYTQK